MKRAVFQTNLLPDGHLHCPAEFARENMRFEVIATHEDEDAQTAERDAELAAVNDVSHDLLSEQELQYYLNLGRHPEKRRDEDPQLLVLTA